jgi:ubiquitin carboxyl-terminal hydrolase 34
LSIQVKNLSGVYESFSKYIEKERINDYKCESCNKKVTIEKQPLLQDLPNVLILHLCRFTFSMETFQQEKVNSRFEFPENLNVEPYTIEG